MYLACTSQSPPNHLACTWLVPRMYLALGGFARLFCILHSSFCLPPAVALGWPWGAYQLAINRLWDGFDVALKWLWGGFGSPSRHFIILHSSFCLRSRVALPALSAFIIHPSAFAPRWLWVALACFTLPAVEHRKSGHSWQDSLSARNNPRGNGLFHPPASIRCLRWLRRSRRVSVPSGQDTSAK
jgi:hypothetical protein